MTTAAAKVRYSHNDRETYVDVLWRVDPLGAFPDGRIADPVLFKQACLEATLAVPLNDAPKGAFGRRAYVEQRLHEAVEFRNRWYRERLMTEGHMPYSFGSGCGRVGN